MEIMLNQLVKMTIEASWLILAVFFIRLLLKNAPKWIRCVMWAMVGLKLAIPFTIESSLSLVPDTQNTPVEYVATEITATQAVSLVDILSIVWGIGFAVMLCYMLFSYILLKRKVMESVPVKDNVMLCDNIASPFVLGVIRPKIYLVSSMTESERQYVLAHEKAHISRGDNIWKPLGFLLLSVYWFNPLCWVAYWLFNKDIELACDEKVIKNLDNKGRKEYSTALLICNSGRPMVTACPVAFGENNVKSRIKNVLSYKKPTVYLMVFALVICSVVAVGFMTSPETQAKEPEPTVVVTEPVTEKPTETEAPTEKATETTEPVTQAATKPVETVPPTTAPQTVATTQPTTFARTAIESAELEFEKPELTLIEPPWVKEKKNNKRKTDDSMDKYLIDEPIVWDPVMGQRTQ